MIGTARHSESLEELVVYRATHKTEDENLWVRPAGMFEETLVIDGVERKRFEKIDA